ncbi:MAG: CPBP family intramembrane metalloprotease [Pirellulales bacterium]|nr:CPBP family intramembrane metalloprotease [Pirellulales bacterium]
MNDASGQAETAAPVVSGYWAESRQPLASLVFVSPLLVVYEIGILALGPDAARNGADVWLRRLLELMDFGQYFLLPALTVCILLAWHHTTHRPWQFRGGLLSAMAIESMLLAVCLRLILQLQGGLFDMVVAAADASAKTVPLSISQKLGGLVGYLGAGVYEELLFRLILLSAVAWGMRRFGCTWAPSMTVAVVATSLVFAAAHYVGPYGESVDIFAGPFWFGFLFRFLAGVFFSVLFVYRGFGIAAGTHAAYDILVGLF